MVIHDIAFHTYTNSPKRSAPCGILFSAIRGEKYSLIEQKHEHFLPNIGAVVCYGTAGKDSFSIFNLLSLSWKYQISPETIEKISSFFSRHYSERELYWFKTSYLNQVKLAQNETEKRQKLARARQEAELRKEEELKANFPLRKKIKAYALFPWYLYKSLKEPRSR